MSQFKASELLRVKMETKETFQREFQRKKNEVRDAIAIIAYHYINIR